MLDFERLPEIADIRDAAARLKGLAVRTPLIENHDLNAAVGARVLVKAEVLQRTGSFKFRGAYNTISRLPPDTSGVVAYSSGNHAQGVAAAAALCGLPAHIVMPADAPAAKVARTRRLGADITLYDRWSESREEIGARIAAESGSVLIKPYDNRFIIAGQGTAGLEVAEQAREAGVENLDAVLINCGGGGLTSGCALALEAEMPGARVVPVEPEGFDDLKRSLAVGEIVSNEDGQRSICDAILTPSAGELTFAIIRRLIDEVAVVTDRDVMAAMAFAFNELKLVVEPGGAASLAALLSGRFDANGKTVAVVLTGGNVDPERTIEALKTQTEAQAAVQAASS